MYDISVWIVYHVGSILHGFYIDMFLSVIYFFSLSLSNSFSLSLSVSLSLSLSLRFSLYLSPFLSLSLSVSIPISLKVPLSVLLITVTYLCDISFVYSRAFLLNVANNYMKYKLYPRIYPCIYSRIYIIN